MDLNEIKKLVRLVESSDIEELEIEEEEFLIRITKRSAPVAGSVQPVQHSLIPQPVAAATFPPDPASLPQASGAEITSPMVGTFYRSPSPDAPPFVKEGDTISTGQVLCIVEAMKLMNEIEAETSGKIVKILVENGQPVEFGQPMFIIEKA